MDGAVSTEKTPAVEQPSFKKTMGIPLLHALKDADFTVSLASGTSTKPPAPPMMIARRRTRQSSIGESTVLIHSAVVIRQIDKRFNLYSDGSRCDFKDLPLVADNTFRPRSTPAKDGDLQNLPVGKPLLNSEGSEILRISQSSVRSARALCQKWLTDGSETGIVHLWVLMPVVFVEAIMLIEDPSKSGRLVDEVVVLRNHGGDLDSILLVPENAVLSCLQLAAQKLDLSADDLKKQLDDAPTAFAVEKPEDKPVRRDRWLRINISAMLRAAVRCLRFVRDRLPLLVQMALAILCLCLLGFGLSGFFNEVGSGSTSHSNYIQLIVAGATVAYVLVTYWLLAESVRQRAQAAMPCISLRYRWIGLSSDGSRSDRTKKSTRIVNVGNGPCYIESFKWNLQRKNGVFQIQDELIEAKGVDMGVTLGKFTGDEAQEISFMETKIDQMWYSPLGDSRAIIEILYYDVQRRRYRFTLRNLQQHTTSMAK